MRRYRALGPLAAVLVLASCGVTVEPLSTGATPTPTAPAPDARLPTLEPTPTPTPTPGPVPREFTLVATGDILLHERLWTQAQRDAHDDGTWNFAPQLASIEPVVSGADLAICHLEVPLAPEDGPFRGFPTFSGPPQIVPALVETGYDACTTASNHTFDQGAAGVDRTLDFLDAAGVGHAGSARTAEEAATPTVSRSRHRPERSPWHCCPTPTGSTGSATQVATNGEPTRSI